MLPQLQAERAILAIEAASVPHMSTPSARETVSKYSRTLERDADPVPATETDLAAVGITVEYVKGGD